MLSSSTYPLTGKPISAIANVAPATSQRILAVEGNIVISDLIALILAGIATDAEVSAAINAAVNALVAGAPGARDTLKELSDALANDENAAATLAASVATNGVAIATETTNRVNADAAITAQATLTRNRLNAAALGLKTPFERVTPTITWRPGASVSNIPNAQIVSSVSGLWPYTIDARFSYIGCSPILAGYTFPTYSMLAGAQSTSTTDNGLIIAEIFTDAQYLDLPVYGNAPSVRVLVNDSEVLRVKPAGATGTAQAGSVSTITLNAGASVENGNYNTRWAAITGGTGAGQMRQITAYNATTKVATISPAWTTAPDATSTYEIRQTNSPFALPGIDGSLNLIPFDFGSSAQRKIRFEIVGFFQGVIVGPNDSVWKPTPRTGTDAYVGGDSYEEATGADNRSTGMAAVMCADLGLKPYILGSGGTGYVNGSGTNGRLTICDRLLPPLNSWMLKAVGAGGTFTLSYGGQTTGAIANNATAGVIQAALQGLPSVGAGNVIVAGSGLKGFPVLFRNALAASNNALTADFSNMTAVSSVFPSTLTRYEGDIAPSVPANSAPFFIFLLGGHNDTTDTSSLYTPASLQAAVIDLITRLKTKWPQATILMSGVVVGDAVGNNAPTTAANNALIAAAAATTTPLVDTMNPRWVTGTGHIGNPSTVGNSTRLTHNDTFLSGVHPSQAGHEYLGHRFAQGFAAFLGI